jgi:DNA polymerase-3 subunit beta
VPFAGEPMEIGFNAEFLRDGVESVLSDEVTLKLISPLRPGLLQGEADDFWYLIMPIRIAG